MTCIAYRDGVLAGDTMLAAGSARLINFKPKIIKAPDGWLAGASGSATYAHSFLEWAAKGRAGGPPKAEADNSGTDTGLLVAPNGAITVYEAGGSFDVVADYFAIGSGRAHALGALYMGASAQEAVGAAIAHDTWSGGTVTVVQHDSESHR